MLYGPKFTEIKHQNCHYYPPYPTTEAVSVLGRIIMKNTCLCFYTNNVLQIHHPQDLKCIFFSRVSDEFIQSLLYIQSSSSQNQWHGTAWYLTRVFIYNQQNQFFLQKKKKFVGSYLDWLCDLGLIRNMLVLGNFVYS